MIERRTSGLSSEGPLRPVQRVKNTEEERESTDLPSTGISPPNSEQETSVPLVPIPVSLSFRLSPRNSCFVLYWTNKVVGINFKKKPKD